MKTIIAAYILFFASFAHAEWKLNPYTQRQDYYEAKAGLDASTTTLTVNLAAEIARATARENAIAVDTGTVNADLQAYKATVQVSTAGIYSALNSTAAALTAEISRATTRENDLGASTGTIKAQADAIAVSTGINTVDIAALKVSTGAIDLAKVNRAGDTMTGALYLSSTTISPSSVTLLGAVSVVNKRMSISGGGDYNSTSPNLSVSDSAGRTLGIWGGHFDRTDGNNDSISLDVNYLGYLGGTTFYRDFRIYNGKSGILAMFDGSSGNAGIGDITPDANLEILATSANTPSSYLLAVSSQNDTTGNIFAVTADGKVGFGAATPSTTVDIQSAAPTLSVAASGGNATLRATASSGWTGQLILRDASSNYDQVGMTVDTSGAVILSTSTGSAAHIPLIFKVGAGGERMRITSAGNVGIGTTAPGAKLHISSGAANPGLKLDGSYSGEYIVTVSSAAEMVFGLHTNGHLSLGGTSPALGTCANATLVTNSHDTAGGIVFSGANSSCEVVFGAAFDATPFCVMTATEASGTEGVIISAKSAAGFTFIPNTGTWDAGDTLDFICMGAHD